MSVGFFLLILLVLIGLAVTAVAVVSFLSGRDNAEQVREARQIAINAKTREKIAVSALRAISNGAGNPTLEAQIALDAIDQSYTKELNS